MPGIYTTPGEGRKVVAAAGTAEALAAATPVLSVVITAETDNTGIIVVGGPAVVAALATRKGAPLSAGDSMTLAASTRSPEAIIDLANIYIDATVTGDGVTFAYLK